MVEDIPIKVFGSSVAQTLSKLQDIINGLDYARRWWNGDNVSAVTLQWKPNGATGDTMQAVVKGVGPGADFANLQPQFDLVLDSFVILVNIPVWREGGWTGNSDLASAGSAAEMASIITCTFSPALDLPAPTTCQFTTNATIQTEDDGYILINDSQSPNVAFVIVEAEDIDGTNANYSTVAATGDASGDNISRYTPPGTSEQSIEDTGLSWDVKRVAVFCVLRNNSSTVSFQVRASISGGGAAKTYYTRYKVVDTSSTDPRVFFIGTINLPRKLKIGRAHV